MHMYLDYFRMCKNIQSYCWWTKSCTTKDNDYPIIYRVLTIPGGAGFCPSAVFLVLDPMSFVMPSWKFMKSTGHVKNHRKSFSRPVNCDTATSCAISGGAVVVFFFWEKREPPSPWRIHGTKGKNLPTFRNHKNQSFVGEWNLVG